MQRRPFRSGSTTWIVVGLLASLVVLGGLIALLLGRPDPIASSGSSEKRPLVVYCAASNRGVMEAVRADYEQSFGRALEIQYGSSQTLLASAEVSGLGDLYLPADTSYLIQARSRGLIDEEIPLAEMQAVVAVAKGNPQKIARLADLLRPEVRLAQGNVEGTAIGKLTKQALAAQGQWEALHQHTTVYATTVNEVASAVKTHSVDAGIVYDVVLHDYPTLEAVAVPELAGIQGDVAVAVLKSSRQPQQALHFARFLSARDRGLERYREYGFKTVAGDTWSEQPELTLYAGSMLRPAIEATIKSFEEREGVRVITVYNGCGVLVAQMNTGEIPDAYFACDTEFMKQVEPLFPDALDLSQNELVILVKKGNPHGITALKDLARPGLRVGIGHEKQCAMGWLTQRTFQESGVKTEVMKNVAVQTPTGDMLVNQMRSGSLDAAVAYLSNAAGAAADLDAIRIQGIPCSVATQPFGIAKDSANRHLSQRLRLALQSPTSHTRFTSEGFVWVGERSPAP